MNFFLKRLTYRIKINRLFLCFIAFAPALTFAFAMAWTPSVHTLSSSFAILSDAPMAKPGTPIGVVTLTPSMADAEMRKSFIDAHFSPFKIMAYPKAYGLSIPPDSIAKMYRQASNLSIATDSGKARVTYSGPDEATGNRLVYHYSNALYDRVQEGYKRQGAHFTPPIADKPQRDPGTPAQRSPLSPEQVLWIIFLFFACAIAGLLFLMIREAMDTSYKSERQIAEHIRLPILGSLPNLNRVPVAALAPQRNAP